MDNNLQNQELLRSKLVDGIAAPLPNLTCHDTWIPRIPGKALSVIGMRRSGKTSLMWPQLADRNRQGIDRSGRHPFFRPGGAVERSEWLGSR